MCVCRVGVAAAVHIESTLTLVQPAMWHPINQKSRPQVSHRSHSHTLVSSRNSGCAHHMFCLHCGNQSPGVSELLVPPPLTLPDPLCRQLSAAHNNGIKASGPRSLLFLCTQSVLYPTDTETLGVPDCFLKIVDQQAIGVWI